MKTQTITYYQFLCWVDKDPKAVFEFLGETTQANKKLVEALEKIASGEPRTWDTTPLYEPYTGAQCSRIAQLALAENAKVLGGME